MIGRDDINRVDYVLVAVVVVLITMGILAIYSAGFDPVDKVNSGLYKRQILWLIIGFVLMILMSFLHYQYLGDYSPHIYVAILVILALTTFFGRPIRNIRAWISFGGWFSIQPSEFMKLGFVIILGKYLELRERDIKHFRELFIPTLLMVIPLLFILKQPDVGAALFFIPILFVMLFVGGADIVQLVSISLIAVIATVVPMVLVYREWIGAEGSNFLLDFFKDANLLFIVSGVLFGISVVAFIIHFFLMSKFYRKIYIPGFILSLGLFFSVLIQNFFKVYQKKRILVFLNPDSLDPHGSGYNIIQSKIAIGSGGFFGKGFLKGSQSQLGFLPEKTSDFIFAVISEEWGFLGSLLMIALFAVLVIKGIQIAFEAKDKYGALLASGITTIFFFHILINIGMVIGIMPVTGIPLCFVSYGGSNLLMSMIAVGILINIRSKKFVY